MWSKIGVGRMTIGKIYYWATLCGKISKSATIWSIVMAVVFVGVLVSFICSRFDDPYMTEGTQKLISKITKIITIIFLFVEVVSIVVPSKEDFLIIAMTKDYTPKQVYSMTKQEIKDSIDYFVKEISKVTKGTE